MRRFLLLIGFAAYVFVVCVAYLGARRYSAGYATNGPWLVSRFAGSKLAERAVLPTLEAAHAFTDPKPGRFAVAHVVNEGPLPMSLSLVAPIFCSAGHDGIHAKYNDTDVYLTPLEIKRAHAFESQGKIGVGFDFERIWALLATRYAVPVSKLKAEARLTRVRMEEEVWGMVPAADGAQVTVQEAQKARLLTEENVRTSIREGAGYLRRHMHPDGRFDYQIDTATGDLRDGYNLPRHAGTTTFVALAARTLNDPALRAASLTAANWLIREKTMNCGTYRCIGENDLPNLGSSALAALAYAAILEYGPDARIERELLNQMNFMRSLQRDDGEFCHQYDRTKNERVDIQLPYFSGEATFALARGARFTRRPEDLEAAKRGFVYATRKAWSFFGSRYLPQEEHWTCQTLAELWDRAPDEVGLQYCVDWHTIQRGLQVKPGEGLQSAVGSFGVSPLVAPRITPAGSRSESAGATLAALLEAHPDSKDVGWLRQQFELGIQFTLQNQVRDFDSIAMDNPELVQGGFPMTTVDGDIRIDTVQHVNAAMIRWLELLPKPADPPR